MVAAATIVLASSLWWWTRPSPSLTSPAPTTPARVSPATPAPPPATASAATALPRFTGPADPARVDALLAEGLIAVVERFRRLEDVLASTGRQPSEKQDAFWKKNAAPHAAGLVADLHKLVAGLCEHDVGGRVWLEDIFELYHQAHGFLRRYHHTLMDPQPDDLRAFQALVGRTRGARDSYRAAFGATTRVLELSVRNPTLDDHRDAQRTFAECPQVWRTSLEGRACRIALIEVAIRTRTSLFDSYLQVDGIPSGKRTPRSWQGDLLSEAYSFADALSDDFWRDDTLRRRFARVLFNTLDVVRNEREKTRPSPATVIATRRATLRLQARLNALVKALPQARADFEERCGKDDLILLDDAPRPPR